ncbi:MAG: hypothetical protein AAGD13_06590 [Pseudomonadota bacterium]
MTSNERIPPKTNPELIPANQTTPPSDFEPERDGALAWMAMRMRQTNPEEV